MDLITPSIGLIFWTSLTFIILLVILRAFAWKPILSAVKEREQSIKNALDAAKKAREEMAQLTAENEKVLKEARVERDTILREAREIKDKIVAAAKETAQEEADNIVQKARQTIQGEKLAAMNELKNHVAELSIGLAEKILNRELSEKSAQESLINDVIDQVKLS